MAPESKSGPKLVGAEGQPEELSPAVCERLETLAEDMAVHPERTKPISFEMFKRIEALVKDVAVDLDEEIEGDVSL